MFSKSYFSFKMFYSYHFFWGAIPAPKSPQHPHTFCFCPSSHLITLHNVSWLLPVHLSHLSLSDVRVATWPESRA